MELSNSVNIENSIFLVRSKQVMLDFHLAEVYQVATKRLNEQVKRNSNRFPESFMFQLTEYLWSQIATSANQSHNQQYPPIEVKEMNTSHDRFLILDEKHLYHIGASLKDVGKKWFAFSQMDSLVNEVLNKLNSNS